MTKVLESDDQITSFSFVVVAKNNVFVRSITGDNPLELIGAVEYAKTHMMVEMHDG